MIIYYCILIVVVMAVIGVVLGLMCSGRTTQVKNNSHNERLDYIDELTLWDNINDKSN